VPGQEGGGRVGGKILARRVESELQLSPGTNGRGGSHSGINSRESAMMGADEEVFFRRSIRSTEQKNPMRYKKKGSELKNKTQKKEPAEIGPKKSSNGQEIRGGNPLNGGEEPQEKKRGGSGAGRRGDKKKVAEKRKGESLLIVYYWQSTNLGMAPYGGEGLFDVRQLKKKKCGHGNIS